MHINRGILILLACCFSFTSYAQLPDEFNDLLFADGYDFPTVIEFDDNGQLYIATKAGSVYVIDSSGAKVEKPLIDIREEVTAWSDHGLMGFALDPNFLNNGYYYLMYSVDLHHLRNFGTPNYSPDSTTIWEPTIGRVTRYQADPTTQFTTTLEGSRKILLGESISTGIPLMYEFHGLGALLAANDGTLIISTGDATSNAAVDIGGDEAGSFATRAKELGIITEDMDLGSYKSQYLGVYSGKILRIDAETGDGLSSNPFYDESAPRSPWSRTWATGFRNPYRIVIKPETGSHYAADGNPGIIYVGDVGNGAWEELNIVKTGGENFGWPIIEGIDLNWSFWISDVPDNQRAPNPLFQNGNCDKAYFNFRELFVRENQFEEILPFNACNSLEAIPNELLSRERLPVIAWSNARWNPPHRAILPGYSSGEGGPSPVDITDENSWVESEGFAGFSSLAGAFYGEGSYPEDYNNSYFAVDFSGWIKQFIFDEEDNLLQIKPFHDEATDIIHLTSNPKTGDLFYLNLKSQIRSISYGGNPPPIAIIETDRNYGPGPLNVQFDASSSFDKNTDVVRYEWDFGDGTTSDEVKPLHTFQASGNTPQSYTVKLSVWDSLGAMSSTDRIISLNNTPPAVDIISFEDGDKYPIDATSLLLLQADIQDKEHTNDELSYEWRVYLHHNDHYHPEPAIYDAEAFTLISPLGCKDEIYWYRVELKVTDPAGLYTKLTEQVYPNCAEKIIDLGPLEGESRQNNIQLQWTANDETGLDRYYLQRSADFFNFETIAELGPQGPNQLYTYIDQQPLNGNNVYRLKYINEERAFGYSNLLTLTYPGVDPNSIASMQLRPNPATNFFEVWVESVSGNRVSLQMFDIAGRKVLDTNWEAIDGQSFSRRLLTSNLSKGTYFYRITAGEESRVDKLLIAR